MSSAFFVTGVRHAFVAVHILLEWEISRKSSGKAYFTAVLGVRIQPRTLWWISILFRTPCQPHSKSGGTHFLQKMSVSALQGTVTHDRNPHPPLPTPSRSIQRLLGQPSQMNNWHSSKNRLLQNGSLIHVTVLYFVNGRIGTYENPGSFQVSPRAKQYQTKSPARSADSLCTAISSKDAPKPEGRRGGN